MTKRKCFAQNITDFIKALSNEKRQEILLAVFADGKKHNITEVSQRVKIAQSTASEHLSLLKKAGVLVSQKIEKEVFYKFNRTGIIKAIDEIRVKLNCCSEE